MLKKHTLLGLSVLGLIAPASAAIQTFSFTAGAVSPTFVEDANSNIGIGSTYLFMGTFDGAAPDVNTSITDIENNFEVFGAVAGPSNGAGFDGYFTNTSFSADLTSGYNFESADLYFVIADVSSFGSISTATQYAILGDNDSDPNWTFGSGGTPTNRDIDWELQLDSNDIIVGTSSSANIPGFATANTIKLANVASVPEPSSTALLGLGSVALLLRRRR